MGNETLERKEDFQLNEDLECDDDNCFILIHFFPVEKCILFYFTFISEFIITIIMLCSFLNDAFHQVYATCWFSNNKINY